MSIFGGNRIGRGKGRNTGTVASGVKQGLPSTAYVKGETRSNRRVKRREEGEQEEEGEREHKVKD